MRENIRALVAYIAAKIDLPEPIVEIGSFQVEGQEELANLRPFFLNKNYIGCDMREGHGVDRIENLEKLTFENESIGTILMLDTIEHVAPLQKAMNEIYRVLKPEGWLIMSSVMDFPVHDYPEDYWRFTPKGFEYLLENFKFKKVFFQGPSFFPHTVVGIAKKGCLVNAFPMLPGDYVEINEKNRHKREYPAHSFSLLLEQFERTQGQLKDIQQSWLWRLTAPFRVIIGYLRGKRRV